MASSQAAESLGIVESLPVELCVLFIEHLAAQGGPQLSRDLASLRLTSKLLHQVATQHFYRIIQLGNRTHTRELIAQLQAQPRLRDTTRAIWWDQKAPPGERAVQLISQPYLVHFANVDEVAFAYAEPVEGKPNQGDYPVGLHYGLREAGPWCHPVEFVRPDRIVEKVQRTPTLFDHYAGARSEFFAKIKLVAQLEVKWKAEHPGETPPKPRPWLLECFPEPKRAIWAMHLVVPGLQFNDKILYTEPKTITHLTITLYEHFIVGDDPDFEEVLDDILEARTMPLLQHLHINCINFGIRSVRPTRAEADPFGFAKEDKQARQAKKVGEEAEWETDSEDEDDAAYDMEGIRLEDHQEWLYRVQDVESIVTTCGDPRVTFDTIELPGLRSATLMEDVRKFTLQQWQERVYHHRTGPWKAPMTQSVRTDPPGGQDSELSGEEDDEDEGSEEDGEEDDEEDDLDE